jgi:hypothetical protein
MPAIVAETSFLHQNPNDGNVCLPLLMFETFEKARRVAPGWDIYCLEGLRRDWIAGKEKPKNPDAAFLAFCRKKYQREGRPWKEWLYKSPRAREQVKSLMNDCKT